MSSTKPTRKRSPHDFIFKQELGQGSYSTVYKAIDRHSAGHVYAIKVCSKAHIIRENKVKYVTIEKNTLNLLARACHPGIVRLFYTFHDEENLYFVLDYASGGELLQLLHKQVKFSESWSLHFACQLIDTIEFIHSKGIIHRDLKPENLLLNGFGRLMITDFGTATTPLKEEKQQKQDDEQCPKCSSFVGTAEYVSPELLLSNQCGFASDIWALGCIIFQFIMGVPPFRGNNELQTFEKIASLDYLWNNAHFSSNKINPSIVKLVQRILVIDPSERPTLLKIKNDSWFEKVDWNNKEFMWRGIWQIPEVSNGLPQRQNVISNKPLHVIDTPVRSIPITKQKKKKPAKVSNTTGSIVEWRKKLGISLPQPQPQPQTQMQPPAPIFSTTVKLAPSPTILPQSTSVLPPRPPRALQQAASPTNSSPTKSSPVVKRSTSQPSIPVVVPGENLYRPASSPNDSHIADLNNDFLREKQRPNSIVLKQDCVNIYEIPFRADGPQMSLKSYCKIDNDIITELVTEYKHELKKRSGAPALLSLFRDGTVSHKNDGFSKHIVNVSDPDLSMYDFEFYEQQNDGFLILEKYKRKIWFISLPTVPIVTPVGPVINGKENWVDCFFRSRQMIEDQKVVDKLKNVQLQEPFMTVPSPVLSRPPSSGAASNNIKEKTNKKKPHLLNKNVNSKAGIEKRQTSSSPSLGINTRVSIPKNLPSPMSPPLSSPAMPTNAKKHSVRSPSSPLPAGSSMSSHSNLMKRYAAPNNMVISSSRYEVLNALKQNSGVDVASSGASAAFRNLQKKKTSQ